MHKVLYLLQTYGLWRNPCPRGASKVGWRANHEDNIRQDGNDTMEMISLTWDPKMGFREPYRTVITLQHFMKLLT